MQHARATKCGVSCCNLILHTPSHPVGPPTNPPTKQPTRRPVIHTVIQPVSQRVPKPPGKSSPSFNQAEEAAAKEQLNIARFIIKHSRGGAAGRGGRFFVVHLQHGWTSIRPNPSPASFTLFTFSLDKATFPITSCDALKLSVA